MTQASRLHQPKQIYLAIKIESNRVIRETAATAAYLSIFSILTEGES